jgi:hypothetical protein
MYGARTTVYTSYDPMISTRESTNHQRRKQSLSSCLRYSLLVCIVVSCLCTCPRAPAWVCGTRSSAADRFPDPVHGRESRPSLPPCSLAVIESRFRQPPSLHDTETCTVCTSAVREKQMRHVVLAQTQKNVPCLRKCLATTRYPRAPAVSSWFGCEQLS